MILDSLLIFMRWFEQVFINDDDKKNLSDINGLLISDISLAS